MKQNKTILSSARAALLLVAALLTNVSAWAQTTESVKYIDTDGKEKTVTATVLEGGGATTLAEGWYVANSDITYTGKVSLGSGDINLILADGATMNVGTGGAPISDSYGLSGDNADLTIYGQTRGTGALNVFTSGDDHTGIHASALTINGGNISANANGARAHALDASYVTINGGTVSATATANNGTGIFGYTAVYIKGGNVTATGGFYGIYGSNVTISGGNVTAKGTGTEFTDDKGHVYYIYGICASNSVTLSGGTVNATGTTSGIYAEGNITLGWTNDTDRITASSYSGQTVKITKPFTDGTTTYIGDENNEWKYFGDLNDELAGATLFAAAPVSYLDENGDTQTVSYEDYTILLGDPDGGADLPGGTYVVCTNITYTGTVTLDGDATIILKDGCTMNVGTSGEPIDGTGIDCNDLTIYGQTAGTGTLHVYTTGSNNHGICADDIYINGGRITANTNGTDADAINAYSEVAVIGGTVTATATGYRSSGIRSQQSCIHINDGTVTASGKAYGLQARNQVDISGGNVNATSNSANGIYAGMGIILDWTNPTDRIYANSYNFGNSGDIYIPTTNGHKLYNGSGFLTGTVTADDVKGKTLQPALSTTYIDADGTTHPDTDAIVLTTDQTTLGGGTYLAQGTLHYDTGITLTANTTLILADNCQMSVGTSGAEGRINDYGIYGSGGKAKKGLTITSQTIGDGMGALSVYTTGTNNYAIYAKDVTINGGTVTADTNTECCPAITADDNITFNGGTISANTTGNDADAIYSDETFNYNGGNLTATAATGYAIYVEVGHYTFNWRTPDDRITIGTTGLYAPAGATATFARPFTDGTDIYSGTLTGEEIAALAGLTLQPGNSLDARQAPDGNYWTTYYNGAFGHVILDQENACAYTATYADGLLTLHKLGTDGKQIPAGCAVIIVADNPEVSMTVTDAVPFTGTNDLDGVDQDTPLTSIGTGTFYVLGMTTVNNEQHFGFHRYTGTEMAARKAFVHVASSNARSLDMVFGEETGVNEVIEVKEVNDDTWYSINGVKLSGKPTKAGLYINKGMKVVIK